MWTRTAHQSQPANSGANAEILYKDTPTCESREEFWKHFGSSFGGIRAYSPAMKAKPNRWFLAGFAVLAFLTAGPSSAAEPAESPLSVGGKLRFHVLNIVGPTGALETAGYAGVVFAMGVPDEWRRGAAGYGMRLASAAGDTAIRHTLAFGMDSALHTDPRYFRARSLGFFPRLGHAFAATVVTRTDSGRSTLATARLTSAIGAAFLSNQWYPDRLNTVGQGFLQGGIMLGLDGAGYVLAEFAPDLKKLVHHKR